MSNYQAKRRQQLIQKATAAAKKFAVGGTVYPLFKGDGSTKETSTKYIANHIDVFKIVEPENGVSSVLHDRLRYCYPNNQIAETIFGFKHKWAIHWAVLCRDKKGRFYYVQKGKKTVDTYIIFDDVTEQLMAENLANAFNKANEDYRLTFCYLLTPDSTLEMEDKDFNALVFTRNTHTKIHTKWEKENCEYFPVYEAQDQIEFDMWFKTQKTAKEMGFEIQVPVKETLSFHSAANETNNIQATICQLFQIPEIIPPRYRKDDLSTFGKIGEGYISLKENFFEITCEDDLEKYQEVKKKYMAEIPVENHKKGKTK